MAIYLGYDRAALDAQYNNRLRVPDFAAFFARWKADSEAARQALAGIGYQGDRLAKTQTRNDRLVDVDVRPRVIEIGDGDDRRPRCHRFSGIGKFGGHDSRNRRGEHRGLWGRRLSAPDAVAGWQEDRLRSARAGALEALRAGPGFRRGAQDLRRPGPGRAGDLGGLGRDYEEAVADDGTGANDGHLHH